MTKVPDRVVRSLTAGLLCLVFARLGWAGDVTAAWPEVCQSPGVFLCEDLATETSIAKFRITPKHIGPETAISPDAEMAGARFTVPSNSPADTSGHLHVPFSGRFRDIYLSFQVYYPKAFLKQRFAGSGGWKIFILGHGRQGCAANEVVGGNPYFSGYPRFYYSCGRFLGVHTRNPYGDNSSEYDYQPGGDTQCLRHGKNGLEGCSRFAGDKWVTFQVHVNSIARWLEVWMTVDGQPTRKIIDFPLNQLKESGVFYEWLKLTPYQTGKKSTEEHSEFQLWYRRLILSTTLIPHPGPG